MRDAHGIKLRSALNIIVILLVMTIGVNWQAATAQAADTSPGGASPSGTAPLDTVPVDTIPVDKAAPNKSSTDKRASNVLLIVVDDLRCSLGCYGASDVKSPNIDRLAARGMRFERAYCQYPVCNSSRTSFLTGLRPDETGIYSNETPLRHRWPEIVLLPQLFRQYGYHTACYGKIIHMGIDENNKPVFHQDAKSWDDCRTFDATTLGKKGESRSLLGPAEKWCTWLAAEGTDEDQPDGQFATAAVRVIDEQRDRPWFLAVGFHKPHDPFYAPKKYFDMYPLDQIQLAKEPADRTPDLSLALANPKRFASFTDQERREFKRAYYAGVSFTDAQVGKLMAALDRNNLWSNTIVVLIGDHGYHLGEHDWWNKVTLFECGTRVPLVVWAPGEKGMGSPTRGLAELVDLYPTLADLCGLTPPHKLSGRSFREQLNDPAQPGKPAAFTEVIRGKNIGRTVRTDRWRYTEWDSGRSGVELYDQQADPDDYHNLAEVAEYASVRAELAALLPKTETPELDRPLEGSKKRAAKKAVK